LGSGETRATSIHNPPSTLVILHGTLRNEAIEIRCEKDVFGNSLFEGSAGKHDGRSTGTIELSKCKLFNSEGKEQATCEVATIKTVALGGRLWLEGSKATEGNRIIIVFKPLGGELIAEVNIKGEPCVYDGTYDLDGTVGAHPEPEKEEAKLSKFIFPVKPIEHVWQPPEQTAEETLGLRLNGTKASLQGEQEVELASKEGFGGFAPHGTHEFVVAGGTLPAKVEGSSETSKLRGEILSTKIAVICKKDKVTGEIEKEAKSKGTITLEECEVENETTKEKIKGCKVPNTEIPITDLLVSALVSEDEFKPTHAEEVLIEIKVEGAECVLKGTYKVKGTQICKLPSGELFAVSHEITCTPSGSKLTLASKAATFESTEAVKLESKKEWAAF
jgi:hypothetical protein